MQQPERTEGWPEAAWARQQGCRPDWQVNEGSSNLRGLRDPNCQLGAEQHGVLF
jgi:hypothetical protein